MKLSRLFRKRGHLGDPRVQWPGLEALEARLLMSADGVGTEVPVGAAAVEASANMGEEQPHVELEQTAPGGKTWTGMRSSVQDFKKNEE